MPIQRGNSTTPVSVVSSDPYRVWKRAESTRNVRPDSLKNCRLKIWENLPRFNSKLKQKRHEKKTSSEKFSREIMQFFKSDPINRRGTSFKREKKIRYCVATFLVLNKKKGEQGRKKIYIVTESIATFHPFKKAVARETMADRH